MARTVLTIHSLDEKNTFSAAFTTLNQAINASDGAEFEMKDRDDKYLILVQNTATSAKNVTVKAGNGLQGVADMTTSLAASSYAFVSLESGLFKNVSGTDKGKVIITGGSADIKVAVFKLP